MSVEFRGVHFTYPGRRAILADFTLSVEPGEVIAVVGRSGAGKTTVLKLVNRLLLPQSGSVLVRGRDTREWDPIQLRRRTGYVFQEVGLFPHLSVEENVRIVPRLEGWAPQRAQDRSHELLRLVGLSPDEYGAVRPAELSGGQRQRVGIARALAASPDVLLMDEPFGALDPVTRSEIRREFTRIQRELRTTAILVTHDMSEAFVLADRVAVVADGALIALATPADLVHSDDGRVRALLETIPRWN